MDTINEQINIIQKSIDRLIKFSYENDQIYNTHFGQMLDITTWHLGQNLKKLKESTEYLRGYNV